MTPDDLAAAMIPVACELACLVRDGDRKAIGRRLRSLDTQDLYALAVVLAAMVPDDVPVPELFAWMEPGSPQREEMLVRAHTRANARYRRGRTVTGPLADLDAEYQRGAPARRKAAAEAEHAA